MSRDALDRLAAAAGPRYRTATEYVEAVLRRGILEGSLPGGTALRQEELASAFGVSRMPVREALRQLEAQALVDFAPHKGAVVTEIGMADAADNYAIRQALEPAALSLSLPQLRPEDLSQARELIDEMESEADLGRLGALNRRFHMTLYGRAGRPRLLALTGQHLASADRYLSFHLAALGREHLRQDDHRALLAACEGGRSALACRILRRHLAEAARNIQTFLTLREDGGDGTP